MTKSEGLSPVSQPVRRIDFVYLGNVLPKYAFASIELARRFSGMEVRLIVSRAVSRTIKGTDIDVITVDDFYNPGPFSEAARRLVTSHTFRDSLWLKSLERLFVLDQFLQVSNLDSFFHAELDQLLFRVDQLVAALEEQDKQGIFLPVHNDKVAVASVMFCNDPMALKRVILEAQSGNAFTSEMQLLMRCASQWQTEFTALPTLQSGEPISEGYGTLPVQFLSIDKTGGFVDAAQIGQWVAGEDPRNVPIRRKPSNLFVDPPNSFLMSKFQLESLRFHFEKESGFLFAGLDSANTHRLYNLHLHSKVHSWISASNSRLERLLEAASTNTPLRIPGTRRTQVTSVTHHYWNVIRNDPDKVAARSRQLLNQYLGRHPSSYPYLSGDTFRGIAHHRYERGGPFPAIESIVDGDIVFCETDLLEEFWETIVGRLASRIRLIVGNSDMDSSSVLARVSSSQFVESIHAQNMSTSAGEAFPLPIGLENAWRHNHGRTKLFDRERQKQGARVSRIMWTFTVGTNESARSAAVDALLRTAASDSLGHLATDEHLRSLSTYQFIASPPGHGLDTHRTWEAMYLRCIPIVLRSFATEKFEELGLPLWIVDSYNELIHFSEADLRDRYQRLRSRFDSEALWSDYWFRRIGFLR